jgi:hypothetical protein
LHEVLVERRAATQRLRRLVFLQGLDERAGVVRQSILRHLHSQRLNPVRVGDEDHQTFGKRRIFDDDRSRR